MIDYDGIQYAGECDLNNALAGVVERLVQAMKDGEIAPSKIAFSWAICDYCSGNGGHSRHLGVISPERWDDWDDDARDDYVSGRYDTSCEACRGSGKVREIDEAQLTPEALACLYGIREDIYEWAAERAAERRWGC